jgi:hypothetical protein
MIHKTLHRKLTIECKLLIKFTLVYAIKYHKNRNTMFVKDKTMVFEHFDELKSPH